MKLRLRRISVKLLLFNILLLSLPMASLLYLDTYESQLLKAQEDSMIQQGRVLSASLTGSTDLESDSAAVIGNLKNRVDSRIRVVNDKGVLLSDSSAGSLRVAEGREKAAGYSTRIAAEDTILYRTAVYPINVLKQLFFPPAPDLDSGEYYSGKNILDGIEIKTALNGQYGAATRLSSGGQRSINLYSAIPVYSDADETNVIGAVLVSRSTYQILSYLYELRLDIIRIFLLFLLVSVILSIGLSLTITVPVVRLKNEAGRILDDFGNFRSHFTGSRRHDEIGELSRSLTELSSDLENKMNFIDQFTSDMLHELKNPLSAVRSAAEMALEETGDNYVLIEKILEEEKRMERMLGELRQLSILENRFENDRTEVLDLSEVLPVILSRYSNVEFHDRCTNREALLNINTDRFVQAVVNPVDNAVSFTPDGEKVIVELSIVDGFCRIKIEDRGPGIRAGGDELFKRFYSERNENEKKEHSGLGLSIVKSITAYYDGSCSIENICSEDGRVLGCRFMLDFPAGTN